MRGMVPQGAGLSSSASLPVAVCTLFALTIDCRSLDVEPVPNREGAAIMTFNAHVIRWPAISLAMIFLLVR